MACTVLLIVQAWREAAAVQQTYAEAIEPVRLKTLDDNRWVQAGLVLAGLAALVLGSHALVEASTHFARALGVSDLVIGLTLVAAGTRLPEVAASIAAVMRGERDIAVDSAVGSNTFDILGGLGLSGLASGSVGLTLAPAMLTFDIRVMLAVALACLPIFLTGREIARWEGGVFLGYYVAYVAYLILAASQHDALPYLSWIMPSFVVPITVITLIVAVIRPGEVSR
jgi:cation:H+ antiporter